MKSSLSFFYSENPPYICDMGYYIIYFKLANGYKVLGLFPSLLVHHWGRKHSKLGEIIPVRDVTIMEWNASAPFYTASTDGGHDYLRPVKDALSIYDKGMIIKQMTEWEDIHSFIKGYLDIQPTPEEIPFESI